jgi:hypothetical protein
MAYRTTKNTGTVSMSAAAVLQSAEGLNLRIKKRKTRRQTPRERERERERSIGSFLDDALLGLWR